MGRLVVVEGLDGAGKRTLAARLTEQVRASGRSVAQRAFPRYGQDPHADLVREGLHGGHGDLGASVYGMAVLYALDRRGAREDLVTALREYDIVLLDRYIASNAAYGAARLRQGADGEFVAWVRSIEVDRYELPLPDLQIYLGVTPAVAAARAAHRERTEEDRARDNFESDTGLQERCAAVYHQLAEQKWLSDWLVTDGTHDIEI